MHAKFCNTVHLQKADNSISSSPTRCRGARGLKIPKIKTSETFSFLKMSRFIHSASNALPSVMPATNCCFQCCSCVNFNFLKTAEGIIKLAEVIFGALCQNLLINYGLTYSLTLGSSYYSFLTTVSSSIMTAFILLLCYVISNNTFQLVRKSLFEILFNGIACVLYISSSCYLAFAVYTFLYPVYKITSVFEVYPAMSTTYIIGLLVGIIHGYDSFLAYKKYH